MSTTSLWARTGASDMSARQYATWITLLTAYGITISLVTASLVVGRSFSLWFTLGAFVVAAFGVFMTWENVSSAVSFVGYTLIAVAFGFIVGPLVARYTSASVVRILFLSGTMVLGLGIVGALIPQSLAGWWTWLLGGLLILLAGNLVLPLAALIGIPVGSAWGALDWFGVILFSAIVVFDINHAMRIPYTMKNAIDSAAEIYLDFVNIAIRLLAAMGDHDDD